MTPSPRTSHLTFRTSFSIIFLLHVTPLMAQESLPYREIPAYPPSYTAATVAARIIDGLGFRYYWATEGLRDEDLSFRPSGEARTSLETITHIYDLTNIIANSVNKVPTVSGGTQSPLTFAEMRKKTLENIKLASDKLKVSTDKDLSDYKMIFKNGDKTTEYPFWNELNGPIADVLWHVGQVVTFRRSSGNPFNSKASVLVGKLRE